MEIPELNLINQVNMEANSTFHENPRTQPDQPPPPQSQAQAHQQCLQCHHHHKNNNNNNNASSKCEICKNPIDYFFNCKIILSHKIPHAQNFICGQHAFCDDCISRYIESNVSTYNMPNIPCPSSQCSGVLDPHKCCRLVSPNVFVRWCDRLCEFAVKGIDKSYCPNRHCSALILNECGHDRNVKKVTCPICKLQFCFRCKVPWQWRHAWFGCVSLKSKNDREIRVLAKKNKWRRCPDCHFYVQRSHGCDSIGCRCGTTFCYQCGRRHNDPEECKGFIGRGKYYRVRSLLMFW